MNFCTPDTNKGTIKPQSHPLYHHPSLHLKFSNLNNFVLFIQSASDLFLFKFFWCIPAVETDVMTCTF